MPMQSPQQFWGPHMASCGQACSPHLECGHAVCIYTAGLQWAPLETLLSVDGPQSAHSMGSQSGTHVDPTFHCGSSVCDELCRHVQHVHLSLLPSVSASDVCVGIIPVTNCSGVSPASDTTKHHISYIHL